MKSISKSFPGVQALKGVDLTLYPGTVHGLVGENGAGKSTLMKVLTGTYASYEGEILIDGKPVHFRNEREALAAGLSIVAQELTPILELSIAENIFLGREPIQGGVFLDKKKRSAMARESLERLGMKIDPDIKMKHLSVAQQQMVEIAKAISRNARVIIMDEPSSALTVVETAGLFEQIRKLCADGITIVYITHKLEEIFEICDHITVMRDGNLIGNRKKEEATNDEIISMMVGRKIDDIYPTLDETVTDEEVLRVEHLTRKGVFEDISFTVHKGEIVGLAGMMGAGRSEIVRAIFGLDPIDSGAIYINGERCEITKPRDAIVKGIGMVTEDRAASGFVGMRSIEDNIVLPNADKYAPRFFLKQKLMDRESEEICGKIHVKAPDIQTQVQMLSGGNQQKVVLAKWLVRPLKLLILDEPTRGIDVGAKQEIYHLIKGFVEEDMGVIMISSEMPEVMAMSHRLLIIANGKIVGELDRKEARQDLIMEKIVKGGK